jgi:HSP20 family protein
MLLNFLIQNQQPPVEIKETAVAYNIAIEIPGSARDDIKIWSESGKLMVTGEKKIQPGNRLLAERVAGEFFRSFELPNDAATDKIEATYRDGVLTIEIPKTEQPKPKSIEIK